MHLVFPGSRIGNWLVIEDAGMRFTGGRWRRFYRCRCDCGKITVVNKESLTRGISKSCGCLAVYSIQQRCTTHGHTVGHTTSRSYRAWQNMKRRCLKTTYKDYPDYGGRGIKVCDRWLKFENFYADMSERPEGLTLDREDNDGDYTPENCKWATPKEQANNRRTNRLITFRGRVQTMAQWADELMLSQATLYNRLSRGWSIEQALTTPVRG